MKRFLTQCLLSYEAAARARIRHQGDWHGLVWSGFKPVEGDGVKRGFLYAVEEITGGYRTLILSEEIPTRPDAFPASGWATKTIPKGFLDHSRYVFTVTANPTAVRGGKRVSVAQRMGLEDDPEMRLLEWLQRKGAQGGFRPLLSKTRVDTLGVETFFNSRKQQVTFHYVRFHGVLEVTSPNEFQAAFNAGIGRGRAFGAGLLLLKPIQ